MPRNRTQYPDRLMPGKELRQLWKQRGEMLEDPDYDARWFAVWKVTLDLCRDQETWDDRDLHLLAEYVEWRRLAEDHRSEAEGDPYQTHEESGRVFAHPGFQNALAARREARTVAEQLCLTPEARRAAGLDDGGDDGPIGDQAGL
jgi:phage terminase small subunit